MKNYLLGLLTLFILNSCSQKHQINIGEITLKKENNLLNSEVKEYYMSFTQEYYDNKKYPVSEYCNDKRAYLTDDKFSTETYLKVTNERTKQSRVGKYPIWFLLNDDASNISCVKKSANFINSEPFIVSSTDELSVKLLQKNEAEKGVPIKELGVLIDFVSLVVPQTANFLLRTNNIINDPITKNYLNMMDNAFKHGDLDGTKSRDFTTNISEIKIKLNVPEDDNILEELGFILLKPKYRVTLTTVNILNGIPSFKFIYNSADPRIEDLMNYHLKNQNLQVKVLVDNFKQVSSEHLVDALVLLNTHLMNRFTRYDRSLILSLALRQSDLYKGLSLHVKRKSFRDTVNAINVLSDDKNPLHDLVEELKSTGCDYYRLMHEATKLIKSKEVQNTLRANKNKKAKEAYQKEEIERQNIENFLRPITQLTYIPRMLSSTINIRQTDGKVLNIHELQSRYNRETNVSSYGCYLSLKKKMNGMSLQNYLIHPSYSNNIKYDYMALSVDNDNNMDVLFYKFSSLNNLTIDRILIDKENQFIMKRKLFNAIKEKKAQSCPHEIIRLF